MLHNIKSESMRSSYGLLLLIVIFLAAVMRLYGLDTHSLWNDELATWMISDFSTLSEAFTKEIIPDVHPPGYQVLIYFIERYVGDSEFWLRLPSALAGIASIYAIYRLGRCLYSSREGLIAAALLTVSHPGLYYSQEARSYSLLMLFAILTSLFLFLIFRELTTNKNHRLKRYIAFYTASAIVASYLHYFGLLLVFCQGIFCLGFLIKTRSGLSIFVIVYTLCLLAYAPWLPYFFQQLGRDGIWIHPPTIKVVLDFLIFAFNGMICFVISVVVLVIFYFKNKSNLSLFRQLSPATLFLLSWILLPFLLAYLKSVLSMPILTLRNLLILLPACYLLIARMITLAPVSERSKQLFIAFLLIMFTLRSVIVIDYYGSPQKQQFREVTHHVIQHELQELSKPLIIGHAYGEKSFNYYFERLGSELRVDHMAGKKEDVSNTKIKIDTFDGERIWFITAHRFADAEYLEFMHSSYELKEVKKYFGARAWLFWKK